MNHACRARVIVVAQSSADEHSNGSSLQVQRSEWQHLEDNASVSPSLHMDRRTAVTVICSSLTSPHALLAQVSERRPHIGFLAEPPLDAAMQRAVVDLRCPRLS
jgi:hypothetical protein